MNVALIGIGKQGCLYLDALIELCKNKKVTISGICDIDENRLALVAREFGIECYSNYQDLVLANNHDFVILSLPNSDYKEVLTFCLNYGINIIKEKPFGLDIDEMNDYLSRAKEKKRVLRIAQDRYFSLRYIAAKIWLDDHYIGKLTSFDYHHTLNDRVYSWYWRRENGGGCLINLGWHMFFILSWFFGEALECSIKMVNNNCRDWKYNVDDTVYFRGVFKEINGSGFMSTIEQTKEESLDIFGDTGCIKIKKDSATLYDRFGKAILYVKENEKIVVNCKQLEAFLFCNDNRIDDLEKINVNCMKLLCQGLSDNADRY